MNGVTPFVLLSYSLACVVYNVKQAISIRGMIACPSVPANGYPKRLFLVCVTFSHIAMSATALTGEDRRTQ